MKATMMPTSVKNDQLNFPTHKPYYQLLDKLKSHNLKNSINEMKFVDSCLTGKFKNTSTEFNFLSNATEGSSSSLKLTSSASVSGNATVEPNLSLTKKNQSANLNNSSETKPEVSKIYNDFSRESLKKEIDDQYFNKIKLLKSKVELSVSDLIKISKNFQSIEKEYNNIFNEISSNEGSITELIDFYKDYLKNNKNFLIRNEILSTFMNKVQIPKEYKDNLANKNIFDDVFFDLLDKMNVIRYNIEVIERNNDNLSKNLLFSIKENYALIDDLIDEKIVAYLKQMFRNKKQFTLVDIDRLGKSFSHINEKENFLNFVIKEYSQFRKKLIEEGLKKKYLKLINLEEIIHNIIKDFQFNFIKEIILLYYFFTRKTDVSARNKGESDENGEEKKLEKTETVNLVLEQQKSENIEIETQKSSNIQVSYLNPEYEKSMILKLLNEGNVELLPTKEEEKFMLNLLSKYGESKLSKTYLNMFINQLNIVLYIMEEISYNNFQKYSSSHYYENKINEVYRITILSFAFCGKIEKILKDIGYSAYEYLNLYAMINNYKKSFSKLIAKVSNDIHKSCQKLKSNFLQILGNESALNETYLSKSLFQYYVEYAKILEFYSESLEDLSEKDADALHPRRQNSFRIIFEFFDDIDLKNEKFFSIYFKILNIVHNNLKTFIGYQTLIEPEVNKLLEISNSLKKFILEYIDKEVFNFNFEEKMRIMSSSDKVIELIKEMIEKCQVYLINLNAISDSTLQEELKDGIKANFRDRYKHFISEETKKNENYKELVHEEEFKNYLGIL